MKTEKPTPQKLKTEAKKGKGLNLKDLGSYASLAAGAVALMYFGSMSQLTRLFTMAIEGGYRVPLVDVVVQAAWAVLQMVAPVYVCVQVVAGLVAFKSSKGVLAFGGLKPDLSKLNPVAGLKNLFTVKVLKEAVKAILLIISAGFAASMARDQLAHGVFAQIYMTPAGIAQSWPSMVFRLVAITMGLFLPVVFLGSIVDYLSFIKSMKMDKREVRQEHKDNEGNPEVKQARKQIAVELSEQAKSDVRASDVILANPTHIAVGIWLHSEVVPMPFVSVHEKGARALAVIRYATKLGIPVVRDIPLARGVHARSRRYGFIQTEDIDPVLRVLAWLRDVERAAGPDHAE